MCAIESGGGGGVARGDPRGFPGVREQSGLERVRQDGELGRADVVGEQVRELDQLDAEPVAQPVALLALSQPRVGVARRARR